MPQQIDVPGMGIVEFPDGMDDAAIASAIQRNMPKAAAEPYGPQQPPVTRGEAFGRGFTGAGSFGFRDELAGLARAGGAAPNEEDPAKTLFYLGRGAYRRIAGDPAAEAAYNAQVEAERATTKRYETEQPGASLAGNITGAVALPLPALRAAGWAGRAGQAAGIGAVTGALGGLGEAEGTLTERLPHAATSGLIGAAAGGISAPLLEAGIAGGRYLAGWPINIARSAINPTGQAERAVGRAYAEAAAADPAAVNRLAPSALGPNREPVVMDVLGQPGRNLGRSAANLSSEARDVLEGTLEPRTTGQSQRFTDWFRQWMHHPDAHSAQEAIDLAERTTNRAAYRDAYAQGDFPIRSDFLERITSAPPVQRAMKAAAEAQQTRAVSEGYGGFRSPVTITADGQVVFNRGPSGVPTYPNLAFWDATRKQISDAARAAGRAGRNEEASVLGNLARSLNAELDVHVPSYQQARAGAAQFFGAENALEAGQKFVNQNFNITASRAAFNKMSDAEQGLFRDGFTSRLLEELGRHERIMNRPALVQRLFESPAAKERIDLVLGPDRARELKAMLHVENIMEQSRRAVTGNSTTAQQLITAGLAGAAGGYTTGDFTGLSAALLPFAKGKLDQRVAAKVANMLISADPKVVDRGVKMIAQNERFMGVLREADSALARAGGEQAGRRAP